MGGIGVGHGDNLAVPGGEPEAESPPAVLKQFKAGMPDWSVPVCRVCQTGQSSAEPDAFDALPAKDGMELKNLVVSFLY